MVQGVEKRLQRIEVHLEYQNKRWQTFQNQLENQNYRMQNTEKTSIPDSRTEAECYGRPVQG